MLYIGLGNTSAFRNQVVKNISNSPTNTEADLKGQGSKELKASNTYPGWPILWGIKICILVHLVSLLMINLGQIIPVDSDISQLSGWGMAKSRLQYAVHIFVKIYR